MIGVVTVGGQYERDGFRFKSGKKSFAVSGRESEGMKGWLLSARREIEPWKKKEKENLPTIIHVQENR